MGYTDLWRCRRCETLPDITFLSGKRFLIECKVCKSKATSIECGSLDEVVLRWNQQNDPNRTRLKDAFRSVADFFSNLLKRPSAPR